VRNEGIKDLKRKPRWKTARKRKLKTWQMRRSKNEKMMRNN
jgi:hypothetical protein